MSVVQNEKSTPCNSAAASGARVQAVGVLLQYRCRSRIYAAVLEKVRPFDAQLQIISTRYAVDGF